jgi:Glycosyl transferase family 2
MTINIITPIYNDTQSLLNTLDAVNEIKESRTDLKINFILVDNMSTDNLVEFLGNYKNPNVVDVFIREKDKGIYDAMNKGLDVCEEGHVLFLGAGDTIIKLPKIIENEKVYYGTTVVYNSHYYVSTLDNFFTKSYGTLHHQSMLVPLIFHRHFNTKYKVCADCAHNAEMIIENRTFEFSPELLAYHMPGGASSNPKIVKKELKIIQKKTRDLLFNGVLPGRI